MSKSLGNTVSPQGIIEEFGADTARFFIMHGANPEKELEWSDAGCSADHKILLRIWTSLTEFPAEYRERNDIFDGYVRFRMHQMIKNVTEHYETMVIRDALNEIIGFTDLLMKYKEMKPHKALYQEALETLTLMLSPIVPHFCEEIWTLYDKGGYISLAPWPQHNPEFINETIELQWMSYENVLEDVKNIFGIIKTEQRSRVTLIVASEWKNAFTRQTIDGVKRGEKFGDLMKGAMVNPDWKQYGKLIKGFLAKITKNPGKHTVPFPSQAKELQFFSENKELLKKDLGLDVNIELESESVIPKREQALPGKPAIIIE